MTGDSAAHTATLTTLTAEVRTLVIGARQVTMSVYGQLDNVCCCELEPFGRASPRSGELWKTYVIGRSTRGIDCGSLVRASVPDTEAIYWLQRSRMPRQNYPYGLLLWRNATEHQRECMQTAAREWAELPLIVLAGLR